MRSHFTPQAGEETISPRFSLRLRGEYLRRVAAAAFNYPYFVHALSGYANAKA